MTGRGLQLLSGGAGLSLQGQGRPGWLAYGLAEGGAADRRALAEGAALLGQDGRAQALELAAAGAALRCHGSLRLALTGPKRRVLLDGAPAPWGAILTPPNGARLEIGGAEQGGFALLHAGGGFGLAAAGALLPGVFLEVGPDPAPGRLGLRLMPDPAPPQPLRLRILPGLHAALFDESQHRHLTDTVFAVGPRASRMGVPLSADASVWRSAAGLRLVSDVIRPGDVQIMGDGMPIVLGPDCQTIGGYPRIATILPADLPDLMQALPGTPLRLHPVDMPTARRIEAAEAARRAALTGRCSPLVRDPRDIPDLSSYSLIDGVTDGSDL